MPGKVVKVLVADGDLVEKGDPLIIVEAMKTEVTLVAPRAGTVQCLDAVEGAMCDAGKPLVEVVPPATEKATSD